jgi:rsbT co-antagonist protein RsbR
MDNEDTLKTQMAQLRAEQSISTTLLQVSRDLNRTRDPSEVVAALAACLQEMDACMVNLHYFDSYSGSAPEWAELVATWPAEAKMATSHARIDLSQLPAATQWFSGHVEPHFLPDIAEQKDLDPGSRQMLAGMGTQCAVVIPLSQIGRLVGVISILWDQPHDFKAEEATVCRALADLIAPTVERHRLMNKLEQMVADRTRQLTESRHMLEMIMDLIPEAIFWKDIDLHFLGSNQAFAANAGLASAKDLIGKSDFEMPWKDQADIYRADDLQVMQSERAKINYEEQHSNSDGTQSWVRTSKIPMRDTEGNVIGILGVFEDITDRKQVEAERQHLQEQVIEAQRRAIQELSTPIIPIMDRIIVMPLIGSIDTMRAKDIMRSLLAGISQYQAKIVILDITGVPIVDSGVAAHLNKTIQAARLKGARTIVTGISDAVAETVVDLGIDWSGIETLDNMQTGLLTALHSLGVKLNKS